MNYTVLSNEAISLICSLLRESFSVSDGISDISVATNSTYSSHFIETKLSALSTEERNYVDEVVGNLNRLVTEVVNTIPTVDNAKSNTLYLYKDSGATSYTQYMLIGGAIVTLGTTEVNLDNYYSKTDTDDKFATKVDLEGIVDTVPRIVPILESDYNALSDEEKNAENIIYDVTDKETDIEALSGKLAELENKLFRGISETIPLTETGLENMSIIAYKYGNMVQLRFYGNFATTLTTGDHIICTLPIEYKPKVVTQTILLDGGGRILALLTIGTDCNVKMHVLNAPTVVSNFAYNLITYIGSY